LRACSFEQSSSTLQLSVSSPISCAASNLSRPEMIPKCPRLPHNGTDRLGGELRPPAPSGSPPWPQPPPALLPPLKMLFIRSRAAEWNILDLPLEWERVSEVVFGFCGRPLLWCWRRYWCCCWFWYSGFAVSLLPFLSPCWLTALPPWAGFKGEGLVFPPASSCASSGRTCTARGSAMRTRPSRRVGPDRGAGEQLANAATQNTAIARPGT